MKKVFFSVALFVCLLMIIVAADFRSIPGLTQSHPGSNRCVGYTIIAFDKGIDCHGDTITLVKRNGYRERLNPVLQ